MARPLRYNEATMTPFGRMLYRWMLDQRPNVTPSLLRERLDLKTNTRPSLQTIHNWLHGDTRPARPYLPALSVVTGIPVEELEAAAGYEPYRRADPVEEMVEALVRRAERDNRVDDATRERVIEHLRRFRAQQLTGSVA